LINNATCGNTNGDATIFISGGTTPYSYSWSNGDASATADSLNVGTYSVTVTYNSVCSTIFSGITISNISGPTVNTDSTDVSCNGGNNGTAIAIVTGGITPYTYAWADGQTNSTATGLSAGTIALTVTDANSCATISSASVNEPAALAVTASATNVVCSGDNDGTVSTSVSGGTTPYTYLWNNAATTNSIGGLIAGTYCVTVIDANGCTANACDSVTEASVLVLGSTFVDAVCNGDSTGIGTVTPSGGATPYTYLWDNGVTDSSATNLAAGTHTVTVTDLNSCAKTETVSISEPPAITASFTIDTLPACLDTNGTVTVSISGGSGSGYTFLWDTDANNQTTQTASGLFAGTFSLTITDSQGCTGEDSVSLSNSNGPTIVLDALNNATCPGACDGAISITASGSASPFSFSWSNTATTDDISGLCAGTYILTVTDANNCISILDTSISQPQSIDTSFAITDATCGNANGQATVSVSGGTSPYIYSWSNSSTDTIATGLSAGTITITITDANACADTFSITINNIGGPTGITFAAADAVCNSDCNGTAKALPVGGTSPYVFAWNTGVTTDSVGGLCAGVYSATVTDANGCTVNSSVTINEPSTVVLDSISVNSPPCLASTGDITVFVSGGTPVYAYLWDASTGNQTDSVATALGAGSYNVTVTDANGCDTSFTASLNNTGGQTVTISTTDITCGGSCDGIATANISGGSTPYGIQWDNGASTATITGLCVGTHTVTVTDASGCVAIETGTVNPGNTLSATMTSGNISCNGLADGFASVSVVGGSTPYTYSWSNSASTSVITGLNVGTYIVSISDVAGCSAIDSAIIIEPSVFGVSSVTSVDLLCNSVCNGQATVSVAGGVSPYNYLWANSQTNATATGLCAGTVSITITDFGGCSLDTSATLAEPSAIMATFTEVKPECDSLNGSLTANPSGGTGSNSSYTYQWDASAGNQVTQTATGLGAGSYNVTITDSAGCTMPALVSLSNNSGPTITVNSVTDVLCFGNSTGAIDVTVTDFDSLLWLPDSQLTQDISGLVAGQYSLIAIDSIGCIATIDTTITEPQQLTVSDAVTASACGACDGVINLSVSGGVATYNFSWDFNASLTDSSATGLCAGSYTGTITDANGCSIPFSSGLSNIGGPDSVIVNTTDISCAGGANGSATAVPFGGTSPYTFDWCTGNTGLSITGLSVGTCSVSVTDSNNCVIAESFIINEPAPVTDTFNVVNPTCGLSDGSITVIPSGGTSPYIYNWNTGDTTQTASGLSVGTYNITITDAMNCQLIDGIIMNNPNGPSITLDVLTDVSCYGLCDGEIQTTVTTINPPATLLWSTGDTTSDISGLCAGVYAITATDSMSCVTIKTDTIDQPDSLVLSFSNVMDPNCNNSCDGQASIIASGGIIPYSFTWSDPSNQSTQTATGLCAGSYLVTVTDVNSCVISNPVNLTDPPALTLSVDASADPLCNYSNDGLISITISGGITGYTYSWVGPGGFSSFSEDVSGLDEGTYSLTVTDFNNCIIAFDTTLVAQTSIVINSVMNDTALCEGDSLTLTGIASGSTLLNFEWWLGSQQVGATQTSQVLPPVGSNSYLFVVSAGQCADSNTVAVVVDATPFAEAGSVIPLVKGICRTIGGAPTGPSDAIFNWSPAEGLSSTTAANPQACPEISTTYYVTSTTLNGCVAIDSVVVEVLPDIVFISGFSPNGDGINDGWQIENLEDFPDVVVEIYNRWGQLLFTSEPGYKDPWEGTFNGNPVPVGTYYYIIMLNHPEFPNPITGPVTIVR